MSDYRKLKSLHKNADTSFEIPAAARARADDIYGDHDGAATQRARGSSLPFTLTFPAGTFKELDFSYDTSQRTAWCMMRPMGAPRFTIPLLNELNLLNAKISLAANPAQSSNSRPLFYVIASAAKGIFNLGGDLAYFVERIKARDEEGLRDYAYACVNISFALDNSLDERVITICLVQGDALGGGLEGALSCNVLIAEKGSKMGLPETLFNTFPGMGAYSILMRKIGSVKAQEMMLSGKIYTAEELHEMGLVTVLAEPDRGIEAARDFIANHERKHKLLLAMNKVRRRVQPVTIDELEDVTDIWVETSLNLNEGDLRRMEILVRAQQRRMAAQTIY